MKPLHWKRTWFAVAALLGAFSSGEVSAGGPPRCFRFNYQAEPEPGERRWETTGDGNWSETYPGGKVSRFREVDRPVIEGCQYIVASPPGEEWFRARFPATDCGDRSFSFSRNGAPFVSLGQIVACASTGTVPPLPEAKAGANTFPANPIATPASHKGSPKDVCTTWKVIDAPITMSTCSYAAPGGSGYYVVENTGVVLADICWNIFFNRPGKVPEKGCTFPSRPGPPGRATCFSCGTANGGARAMELIKYVPK